MTFRNKKTGHATSQWWLSVPKKMVMQPLSGDSVPKKLVMQPLSDDFCTHKSGDVTLVVTFCNPLPPLPPLPHGHITLTQARARNTNCNCLWNSSHIGPYWWCPFQGRSRNASSTFYASHFQAVDGVMSLALCLHGECLKLLNTPGLLRRTPLTVASFAHQSICSIISLNSCGMSRKIVSTAEVSSLKSLYSES